MRGPAPGGGGAGRECLQHLELDLRGNGARDAGAHTLAQWFHAGTALERLSLHLVRGSQPATPARPPGGTGNQLTDAGVVSLLDSTARLPRAPARARGPATASGAGRAPKPDHGRRPPDGATAVGTPLKNTIGRMTALNREVNASRHTNRLLPALPVFF